VTSAIEHAVVRDRATTLARAAAWSDVAAFLGAYANDGLRTHPELATLQAEALLRTGRPRDARAWLDVVIADPATREDRAVLRRAINLLGAAEFVLGDLDAAGQSFGRALEMGEEDGDQLTVARATNNLGAIANVHGRHDDALACFHLTVPVYRRLDEPSGLAQSFHNMAITFRDLGHLARADECERWAIDHAEQGQDEHLATLARLGRAEVGLRAGDVALAESAGRSLAQAFDRLGDPIGQADAHRLVGAACTAQGKLGAARAALDTALALARTYGGALPEAETLRACAELAYARGDRADTLRRAEEAFAVYARLGATDEARRLIAWATARVTSDGPGIC